jgi:hypothetical protein
MNTPVSFELAKLLNDKGLPGLKSFYDNKKHYELNPKKYTIAEVVMWLYEKHGIWIKVDWYNKNNNGIFWSYTLEKIVNYPEPIDYTPQNTIVWNSPTEAYEAAILYTLNNLI